MPLSRTNVISSHTAGQIAGGSFTTGSFTPANNSLLVVVFHMQSSLTTFSPTITDSLGSHLVYTNQKQIGPDTTNHHATAVFTAPVGTGASMTVTCGGGPSDGTFECVVHVYTYTGYNTSTPVGATASLNNADFSAAVNLTLSAAPATTSEVLGCAQSDTSSGAANITAGTGWTAEFADSDTLNIYSLDEVRDSSTSTNVLWNANAAGGTGVALAIEIKAAAAGAVTPFTQTDWPIPRSAEPYSYRSWEFRNSRGLLGKDILPHRQQDWPLPQAAEPDWRRSWTWSYNLNLIGKDVLPYRQMDWPLPQASEPDWRRSWTWTYNLNLIGKDVLPHRQQDWPNPASPYRIDQTWLQNPLTLRTLTLRLPFNQFDWPNPQPVIWYRDWSQNLAQFAPVAALPHNQFDWPIPQPVTWYRDWALNLLQTTLAPTQIFMALPPIWDLPEPAAEIDRFYTQNLLTTTLAPVVVLPFRQQDWPLPAQLTWYRDWSQNLLQTTLKPPVVQLPFNQYDWPLPARPFYPLPDINWQNPLVLGIPIPPPVTGFHYVTTSRAKFITPIGVS